MGTRDHINNTVNNVFIMMRLLQKMSAIRIGFIFLIPLEAITGDHFPSR